MPTRQDLRFRGGRQVANRAPNITELFTPRGGSVLEGNAQDACGSWQPATPVWGNTPGNPHRLKALLAKKDKSPAKEPAQ